MEAAEGMEAVKLEPINDLDNIDLADVDAYSFTHAQIRWLISELRSDKKTIRALRGTVPAIPRETVDLEPARAAAKALSALHDEQFDVLLLLKAALDPENAGEPVPIDEVLKDEPARDQRTVDEAVRLGRKRVEAMRDLALRAFDEAIEGYPAWEKDAFRVYFYRRMGAPITHGRPKYEVGDRVATDRGVGHIVRLPDTIAPHTAGVRFADGGLYNIPLSVIRRLP